MGMVRVRVKVTSSAAGGPSSVMMGSKEVERVRVLGGEGTRSRSTGSVSRTLVRRGDRLGSVGSSASVRGGF